MTAAQDNPALRHIRRLVSGPGVALSDPELLQRYIDNRDEAAFAALVERHGPMVLELCQAILSNRHDAEDACQATFVVLARKASLIRKRDSAGSWLHGVAYRVARKALAAAARRHALDAKAPMRVPEGSTDDLSWREVRAILHAELAALPERFREPLILCYLEGHTQDEAARRLGWAVTTVKGRLQKGREVLRRRLVRKGLDLAALLGATLVAGKSFAAPVQRMLMAATLRAVFPATGETANSAALNLVQGILQLHAWRRFSLLAALLLLATAVVTGSFAFLRETPAEREPAPPAQQGPARLEVLNDAFGDPLPQGAIARLGTIRFNHGNGLNSLHFSPDGKTIISEGNGFVRTWDAATGKELAQLTTTRAFLDDQTALTPDGKKMIFLDQEPRGDTLRIFDLEQAMEVRRILLPVQRRLFSLDRRNAISFDGRLCAAHTAKLIRVFEVETARELYQLPKLEEFQWVCFAGNDWLVTTDQKKLIEVREAKTGRLVRQFDHSFPVAVIVASPDGRLLATAEHHSHAVDRLLDRDVIHLWDLTTGTLKHTLPARPKQWYMKMHFATDGKRLFATSSGSSGSQLSVWDTELGQRLSEFSGIPANILAVSPDGHRLATGALPGKFELLDLRTGRRLSPEVTLHAHVPSVFLSADGARAFTMGYSSFNAWDGITGRRLDSYAIDLPPSLYDQPTINHSRDGRYAVSLTGDLEKRDILVWDLLKRRQIQKFQASRAARGGCTAISPDGSMLVTSQPGTETIVRIRDVRTGKELRSFKDSKAGWPGSIFLTADGNTLFLAGRQQIVGFDIRSTRELFSWRMAPVNFKSRTSEVAVGAPPANPDDRLAWQSLTVSADGRTIACILSGAHGEERLENRIALYEGKSGKIMRRWSDSGKTATSFGQLAFSDDGRLLASSDGLLIHVWEVATGKEVLAFNGHQGQIRSLNFSANARRLASASSDSTVLIWDLVMKPQFAGPAVENNPKRDLERCWTDLASEDAAKGYAAIWRMMDARAAAVAFLRGHLRPATNADTMKMREHIQDLDSSAFTVREKAQQNLKALGVSAAAVLRETAARELSPEARSRVEQLLDNLDNKPLSGEPLRLTRALTVLERLGTPDAQTLVAKLADGASGAWLTEEAKAVRDSIGLVNPAQ